MDPSAAPGPRSIPLSSSAVKQSQREGSTQGKGTAKARQFIQASTFFCASANALALSR
jgi:hypothetical protein